MTFSLPAPSAEGTESSHDSDHTTPAGLTCDRFSLIRFRSPLLTESRLFSLPVGTEMFHFPTFPPHALCVQARVTPHDWCGVPPFGNPRINARLTAPRGLSQPPTSFIGSWCQGIHRAPLKTWPHKNPTTPPPEGSAAAGLHKLSTYRVRRCSRPLCSSQRTTRHRPHSPAEPIHPAGQWWYEEQAGPAEKKRSPPLSGPNSVPTHRTPTPELRSTHPPKG